MTDAPVAASVAALSPALAATFNAAFTKLWPHSDITIKGLGAGIMASAPTAFPKYGWDTALLICHAMAQFSEETDCGREMQENMNYSAGRLLQVFRTHFTYEQAIVDQHNPRAIADRAYGGRMGNAPPPSDDGWNCRGQGLSQLTGAGNYKELQKRTGIPVYDKPATLLDPALALEIGLADLTMCGCLPWAKKDNLLEVSALLNVGHVVNSSALINGFTDRSHWLALWKHAMGIA